jgi:hypothetical protein
MHDPIVVLIIRIIIIINDLNFATIFRPTRTLATLVIIIS